MEHSRGSGYAPSWGLLLMMMINHHHRLARPWQDIAVSMSLRHLERSCARFHAKLRPRLCYWRSSSSVRSQVRLGRLGGRCQSTGRRLMAARRARECLSGLGMNQHQHFEIQRFQSGTVHAELNKPRQTVHSSWRWDWAATCIGDCSSTATLDTELSTGSTRRAE